MQAKDLDAVIFDVDGTLAETERHGHRVAFNKAFEELGMEDRWNEQLYAELLKVSGGDRRLYHYFTNYQHIPAEEASELAAELHARKTRLFIEVVEAGEVPDRPGVIRLLKELEEDGTRLGVATTGTRRWVLPLLEHLTKKGSLRPFETIVTGDDVTNLKPDPEAFRLALEQMAVEPNQAVIVEDSKNGVHAAKAAECCCLAVLGEYAEASELENADLVVDAFGAHGSPLKILSNPFGVDAGPVLTPGSLKKLHARWLETRSRDSGHL
jgi:HAD superfamily hydrolase (TIGR01509 family)